MNYRELWQRLTPLYTEGEAHAIADCVLQEVFGLSKADALCGGVEGLSAEAAARLEAIINRLRQAEPVQYVLGHATFCGREFVVRQGVLIPRPETEELCRWIACENEGRNRLRVLDIGTGSGCIAITLSLALNESEVTAWDISPEALRTASENAERLGADISIERHDALSLKPHPQAWDVIVSNPPYICEREKAAMHANVLSHEPALALFVPDAAPLLFYRKIAQYAAASLRPQGRLYFEINPQYAADTVALLREVGFSNVTIKRDEQGKERMMEAAPPRPSPVGRGLEATFEGLSPVVSVL